MPNPLFSLFRQKPTNDRVVVETVRPGEVEVVTKVKRALAKNYYSEAVRYAYQIVLYDLERAYGLNFPSKWTNRDILAQGLGQTVGYLPDLVRQLYDLYEPVRFGRTEDIVKGDVLGLIQSIYGERKMWQLYVHRETRTVIGHDSESGARYTNPRSGNAGDRSSDGSSGGQN